MNNLVHYRATIRLTSANEIQEIQIPSTLDLNHAKFVIGSIAGKVLSGGPQLIHIHCENLRHHCNYTADTGGMDLIGRVVLSETVSIQDSFESENFMGCIVPADLGHQPKLKFRLTDATYQPLTTLSFIEFELNIVSPHSN